MSFRAVHLRHATPPPEIQVLTQQDPALKTTKRQRLFVEDCMTASDSTFDEVMKKHHVTTERFVDWMLYPPFRRYLRQVAKALQIQADLILAIGQKRSAMHLLRTASVAADSSREDSKRTSQTKAAAVLLKMATMIQRHDHMERTRERMPGDPPDRRLAHPDHSEQEVLRLLDIVEGKAPAD